MQKVSVIFGTRPEAIKMAMVIKELQKSEVELSVCFTGQHKEMVAPLIEFFDLPITESLDLMRANQSLSLLTSNSLEAIDKYLNESRPDIVLVQGDTTTAMCASTAAFYNKIKVGHVEAGLRTYDISAPYPEEFNRRAISIVSSLHFAPTEAARNNLLSERITESDIHITGNTVVDALYYAQNKLKDHQIRHEELRERINQRQFVLITGHRRENFGQGFKSICMALKELSIKYSDYDFVYPVHLNPNVQEPVRKTLSDIPNLLLIEPLDYIDFISLLSKADFVLTDSGGVQEEAASMKKPTLVMRTTTERGEAIDAGIAKLVGSNTNDIVENVDQLMRNETLKQMAETPNPFGDGKAAERIASIVTSYF